MKVLFLDESGDHNLTVIDSQYPLFILGGIIVDKAYAEERLAEAVSHFKRRLFGRDDIVLHTADITRNRNGFEQMKERVFRERFYRELNDLMCELEYVVVAWTFLLNDFVWRSATWRMVGSLLPNDETQLWIESSNSHG